MLGQDNYKKEQKEDLAWIKWKVETQNKTKTVKFLFGASMVKSLAVRVPSFYYF